MTRKLIQPLHDRILVQRVETAEASKGGIFLPHTAREKPVEGKVVAAGDGRQVQITVGDRRETRLLPLEVQAGDRVIFGKLAGSEIKIDNQEYLILREDDVIGVIEPDHG